MTLTECRRGDDPAERLAVFRGWMRAQPGSARMALRFRLRERVPGARSWRAVKAPGLGVWRRSRTGVRRFAHRQRVLALTPGAAYRTIVYYRWQSADGEVVARKRRRSPVCRQSGRLPDLRPLRVTAAHDPVLGPGAALYTLVVGNEGAATATGATATLLVDGVETPVQPLGRIASGRARAARVVAARCAGRVELRADPAGAIVESDESDNALVLPCPPVQ